MATVAETKKQRRARSGQTNSLQARHLRDRMDTKLREQRGLIYRMSGSKEPAVIKRARALVANYDKQSREDRMLRENMLNETLNSDYKRVGEIVLFGKPADALAAVQQFEQRTVK